MTNEEKPHQDHPPSLQPREEQSQAALAQSAGDQAAESKERIYEPSSPEGPLRQCEIISDLVQVHLDLLSFNTPDDYRIKPKNHPFAIVITQDCDVIQDFRPREQGNTLSDKIIPNLLFCEAITAEELRGRRGIDSQIWKRIRQNKDERYQFLEKVVAEDDALGIGLPELGVDFKRYFTIPADEVYLRLKTEAKRRCHLVSPYMEHFSVRFYNFQARIALPAEHHSE